MIKLSFGIIFRHESMKIIVMHRLQVNNRLANIALFNYKVLQICILKS